MGRGWLDSTTKQRSVNKVDAITQMVAYPDQIFNDTYLEDLYAEVNGRDFMILNYHMYCVQLINVAMETGLINHASLLLFLS